MAFENLTGHQTKHLLEIVGYQETGKYEPQMFYIATMQQRCVLLAPKKGDRQNDEKQVHAAEGIQHTDLVSLADEGYITLSQPGKTPLVALKQKAVREYQEWLGGSKDEGRVNRGNRIFIGHGRSKEWMVLRDFLENKLGLPTDEFNRKNA
jgi:hypothetical protein